MTGQPQARVPARPSAEPAADAGEMFMHAALPPQTMQARLDSLGGALDAVRGELAGTTSEYNRLAREASTAADGDPVHHRYALARGLRAALVERWTELSMQIKDLQARQAALPRARVQELAAGLRMLAAVQDVQDPGPGGPGTLAHKAAARANRRHLRAGAGLLGRHEELAADQHRLRALLRSGSLDPLPPAEQDELRQLASLDTQRQFGRLRRLEEAVMQAWERKRH